MSNYILLINTLLISSSCKEPQHNEKFLMQTLNDLFKFKEKVNEMVLSTPCLYRYGDNELEDIMLVFNKFDSITTNLRYISYEEPSDARTALIKKLYSHLFVMYLTIKYHFDTRVADQLIDNAGYLSDEEREALKTPRNKIRLV